MIETALTSLRTSCHPQRDQVWLIEQHPTVPNVARLCCQRPVNQLNWKCFISQWSSIGLGVWIITISLSNKNRHRNKIAGFGMSYSLFGVCKYGITNGCCTWDGRLRSNELKWFTHKQRWEVTKYKYFVMYLSRFFLVSVLYFTIYFSDYFVLLLPTLLHKYLYFLLLTFSNQACYFSFGGSPFDNKSIIAYIMNRLVLTGNAIWLSRALRLRQKVSTRVINARDSRMEWIREEKLLTCSGLKVQVSFICK